MQIIKLEVEDSNVDIVLTIVQNLKKNIVTKYEIINENLENRSFTNLSQKSLDNVWDNSEDDVYDKFLKV